MLSTRFGKFPGWVYAALLFSSALGAAFAQFLSRDHPVGSDEIRIGMSNAQSGRTGAPGVSLKHGWEAYLTRINAQGGIAGRHLRLISYDDRGEPINTVQNVERLVNQDRVFALVAFTGTACCEAVLSMINEANIVLLGPAIGAEFARDASQPNVFTLRASDADEAETLVSHLTGDLHFHRIGLFRQDDSYGNSCKKSVQEALQRRGLVLAGEGVYQRSSAQVQEAVDDIVAQQPEAVIAASSYKACAELILRVRQQGLKRTLFCALSAIGPTQPLIDGLKNIAEGLVVAEVVPDPDDNRITQVQEYRHDMEALGLKLSDHWSLEGYLAAYALVHAMRDIEPDFSEDRLRDALARMDLSIGSLRFHFGANHSQANHAVFLSQVKEGRLVATNRLKPIRSN